MKEPSFNSHTSEHTTLHLHEATQHFLHRALAGGNVDDAMVSLRIAADGHARELEKEQKP